MKNHKRDSLPCPLPASCAGPLLSLLVLVGISLFAPACYEAREGCLDVNAVNYALDSDRECDGCCEYPVLSIRFVHVWDDGDTSFTFRYDSGAFLDGDGQPFAIDRITYYVQNIGLYTDGAFLRYTADSVEVQQLTATGTYEATFIRDDYLLLNPARSTSLEVGTLFQNGTFTALRFQVGLDAETDDILPGSLPTNHPLSLLDSTMYDLAGMRYLSNRLELRRDPAASDAPLILSYGTERARQAVTLDIPGGFALSPGLDLDITLQVNYARWFEQIEDIRSESEEELLNKIVAGLPNSFTFLEISANER